MAQMFDEIMQNMEKELIQQRGKVNQAGQQRQIIGRRLEILEQNLAENKVVMMELCKWPKLVWFHSFSQFYADSVSFTVQFYTTVR